MQQQIKEYGHFLRTALLWYVTERVVKSLTVVSDSADPAADEEASVGGDVQLGAGKEERHGGWCFTASTLPSSQEL